MKLNKPACRTHHLHNLTKQSSHLGYFNISQTLFLVKYMQCESVKSKDARRWELAEESIIDD